MSFTHNGLDRAEETDIELEEGLGGTVVIVMKTFHLATACWQLLCSVSYHKVLNSFTEAASSVFRGQAAAGCVWSSF